MVNFFHRTSTHKVYQIIMEYDTLDEEFIYNKMLELGHKRRLSDIRGMIKLLEHFQLTNKKIIELVQILMRSNPEKPNEALVYVANEFVNEMMERGLLLRPFLEAVNAYPNKNSLIQYELVERAKKYGYYDQRIGHDISAAMRNFTSMINLTVSSNKSGIYELTALGKKVIEEKELVYQRIICDVGEPCRKACPTGALSATRINQNCIACGLCVDACPYGALKIDCNLIPPLSFDLEICKKSSGFRTRPIICSMNKILADEIILQRWIKQVFGIAGIKTEIPGIGKYPDLVTLDEPSFVEVKKIRITERKKEAIINQITHYTTEKIIKKTLEQVSRFSNYKWKEPEYMILIAKKGGVEKEVIGELEKNIDKIQFGFIPIKNLNSLASNMFNTEIIKREKLSLVQLFNLNQS